MRKLFSILCISSVALLSAQTVAASEAVAMEKFMTKYVQTFNAADLNELSTSYFNTPFIRVTETGPVVLATNPDVVSFLKSVIKSSGVLTGMRSEIHSLDSCTLSADQVLVVATFNRRFPNSEILVRSFSYLLLRQSGEFRIMAMFPAPASNPLGCSNDA